MQFNFGFSYVGLVYLLMLFIPNFFWSRNKPQGYDEYAKNENGILLFLERLGEISTSTIVLIFDDFNINTISIWTTILVISFLLLILYELYWIKYFKSAQTMLDFYSDYLFFPVAGATLPVLAFFLLGIYGKNIFLLSSVILLGIGHIGIHLKHRAKVQNG